MHSRIKCAVLPGLRLLLPTPISAENGFRPANTAHPVQIQVIVFHNFMLFRKFIIKMTIRRYLYKVFTHHKTTVLGLTLSYVFTRILVHSVAFQCILLHPGTYTKPEIYQPWLGRGGWIRIWVIEWIRGVNKAFFFMKYI